MQFVLDDQTRRQTPVEAEYAPNLRAPRKLSELVDRSDQQRRRILEDGLVHSQNRERPPTGLAAGRGADDVDLRLRRISAIVNSPEFRSAHGTPQQLPG